jgi:hypothetical protein
LAGRPDKIAQNRNVGPVCTDAPGIHGQTEPLGEIQIDTGIIKFRRAEILST